MKVRAPPDARRRVALSRTRSPHPLAPAAPAPALARPAIADLGELADAAERAEARGHEPGQEAPDVGLNTTWGLGWGCAGAPRGRPLPDGGREAWQCVHACEASGVGGRAGGRVDVPSPPPPLFRPSLRLPVHRDKGTETARRTSWGRTPALAQQQRAASKCNDVPSASLPPSLTLCAPSARRLSLPGPRPRPRPRSHLLGEVEEVGS